MYIIARRLQLERWRIKKSTINEDLRAAGHRLTRTRRAVLEVLERTKYPLSASELYERLTKNKVAIDLVTVYRTLSVLRELGVVAQIELHKEGQARFEIRHGREHHHHIRCQTCGKIADLLLCPLKKLTAFIEKETQFVVNEHTLEFSGLCPKCQ
ncbi:MAG: transcriptional repressor [Nitrospirales bacterium]|nr:MAG: transcriptional repressor [Nitrospirales bacterium]